MTVRSCGNDAVKQVDPAGNGVNVSAQKTDAHQVTRLAGRKSGAISSWLKAMISLGSPTLAPRQCVTVKPTGTICSTACLRRSR